MFEFDPFDHAYWEDPYPYYRTLRHEHPVYSRGEPRYWMLSRYDDVLAASADWKTFSSAKGVIVGMDAAVLPPNMFNMDPPRHDELRGILNRVLTPGRAARMEDFIRQVARGLIERFADAGRCDATVDYAQMIPCTVFAEFMGIPEDDRESFLQWNLDAIGRDDFADETALAAWARMDEYFGGQVPLRREQRTDDLISAIFYAEVEGDDLTDQEVRGFCSMLLTASQHTTINLMSNGVVTLARHPDQLALLRDEPQRWHDAIEELLRYESPVQGLARLTTREVTLHGETIPAGAWVQMLHASANHDETVFPDPERFDITRKPDRHLSFGHGIHHCLGNAVARLQTRVALEEMVSALGEWEVDEAGVVRNQLIPGRGVANVPITFSVRARV